MSLEISQVWAQIGLDRSPSKLEIRTQPAILELEHKEAKVNIHTELTKIEIDQHDCFSSAGLKSPFELTKEAAERGHQAALEYIGKTASDGDRLAAIELGGNPIADIAKRDSYTVHEFGLDFIPKVRPKITVKGSVELDPERNAEGINNGVYGNYIPGDVNYNYTPTQINIYMKQYSSISYKYTPDNKVDTYI